MSDILRFLIVVAKSKVKRWLSTSSVLPICELHLYVPVSLLLFSTKEGRRPNIHRVQIFIVYSTGNGKLIKISIYI